MARLVEKLRNLSPNSWLVICAGAFVALLLVQAVRYAAAARLSAHLGDVPADLAARPTREDAKPLEEYQPIVKTGHFGAVKKPPQPQLFGILGESALIGNSPKDAKLYAIGAEVPGGEKLVEIHPNSVVLEKEGKKRTLTLFPELPGKPGPSRPKTGEPRKPEADAARRSGKEGKKRTLTLLPELPGKQDSTRPETGEPRKPEADAGRRSGVDARVEISVRRAPE